jgi:hypothetical protein
MREDITNALLLLCFTCLVRLRRSRNSCPQLTHCLDCSCDLSVSPFKAGIQEGPLIEAITKDLLLAYPLSSCLLEEKVWKIYLLVNTVRLHVIRWGDPIQVHVSLH